MRYLQSTSRAAFAASAVGLMLLGCPGSLDHPERFAYLGAPPDAGPDDSASDGGCDVVANILPPNCTTSACHSAQSQQGNLDLESPGLPKRLVNKAAHGGPGLLIDPKVPSQSVLLTKLTKDPPFFFQMPLGADPLSLDELACLQSWVAGAVAP